jgi:hypothetical protein
VKKLIISFERKKSLTFAICSLLILVLLFISPAAAKVNDWKSSPQNPVSGNTLTIQGSASPEEKINVFVTFEKAVPVSGGKYEYILDDVKIPEGSKNSFKVEASGVKKLNVRVKMLLWWAKSSDASGNSATVSQSNVPSGTYPIRIDGDASEGVSEVNLKIIASQEIEADSNGDFSYSYNTKSVPAGNFEIEVGGITREINVQPQGTTGSTQDSSPDSGSGSSSHSADSSSKGTGVTSNQLNKISDSTSTSSTTGSSLQPGASKGLEGVTPPNANTNPEGKAAQTPLSGENVKTSNSKSYINVFYLLVGVVAGILILLMYSMKKRSEKK